MRNRGTRHAEEAEMVSHRVMGEQRRLWEVWCNGLNLSNGNRLATQRDNSLFPALSLLTPLSGRGGTGSGLKCKKGRGSETGGKWEEQRAEWGRDETEMVPAPALQHGRDRVFVHVCGCVLAMCVCAFLFMSRSEETLCRLLFERTNPIESLHGPPSGIDTELSISWEWGESGMSEKMIE